ncbi:MAG TPA: hypothetical protein VFK29_04360 [Rhodanobacteraceae bacterium]|nr:hypothetical protein [Rhodanobacteraceae bacterium]
MLELPVAIAVVPIATLKLPPASELLPKALELLPCAMLELPTAVLDLPWASALFPHASDWPAGAVAPLQSVCPASAADHGARHNANAAHNAAPCKPRRAPLVSPVEPPPLLTDASSDATTIWRRDLFQTRL